MAHMRTVDCQFTQEDFDALCINTDSHKAHEALAYLMTWAMDAPRYAKCVIWITDGTDLNANYLGGPNLTERNYSIGAIWHGDRFGFHS